MASSLEAEFTSVSGFETVSHTVKSRFMSLQTVLIFLITADPIMAFKHGGKTVSFCLLDFLSQLS